jgi:hypothetical protein
MAHADRVHDEEIEAMQEASAAVSIGVLFLAVSGFSGIFVFQAFRSGTEFWRIYVGVLGLIGLLLTGWGIHSRHNHS